MYVHVYILKKYDICRSIFWVPSFLNKVVVEESETPALQVPALVQVVVQERAKQRNEISIVVLKALSQSASLGVESGSLNEQRVILGLELGVKHHSIHDVVQHKLQPFPYYYTLFPHSLFPLKVLYNRPHFILPHVTILVDYFVCEEWKCHDPSHFAPMVSVDREDHVLSVPREDVEDYVPRTGPELHTLCMEDLVGELGVRNNG